MGVTVVNKPYNYAQAGLFNTAFGILGDQISRMSDRAHEAKKVLQSRADWQTVSENMEPRPRQEYIPVGNNGGPFSSMVDAIFKPTWDNTDGLGKARQGDVNDFAHAMALTKNPAGAFEPALKIYEARFANQEKEDYANRITDTYNARGGYDRNDQSKTMENLIYADLAGANTGNYIGNVAPNMQGQIVDTGDKQVPVSYNPFTGGYTQGTGMDVRVNPTSKYVSDNSLEGTKIGASATRAAVGAQPKFSMVQGEDGQIYAFDQRTGRTYQNGQPVEGVRLPGKSVGLVDQAKIQSMVGDIIQLSTNEEDYRQRIGALMQQNPQYAQLIEQAANSTQVWGPKGILNEPKAVPNPYYKDPRVARWREAFPGETAGMTDEQVLAAMQKAAHAQ